MIIEITHFKDHLKLLCVSQGVWYYNDTNPFDWQDLKSEPWLDDKIYIFISNLFRCISKYFWQSHFKNTYSYNITIFKPQVKETHGNTYAM